MSQDRIDTLTEMKGPSPQRFSESKDAIAVTVDPPSEAPDGGTRAWIQTVGCSLVFANLWGMPFAFGTFQSYYELNFLTSYSPSQISWIGTTSTFLLIFGGITSGPLFDWGYFRRMLLIGAFVETLSVFLLSLCTEYYQIYLTQGLLLGLGNAFLYIPGLALVGRAFKKHRSLAMAVTTCGAPIGGIIYTLIFQRLNQSLGFAWSVRVMGFVMLASYIIAFPLILWRASNLDDIASGGSTRRMFDPSAFKDPPFWLFTTGNFLVFCGYMIPFVYIATFGQIKLGMSQSDSLNVIIYAQAASILGRLAASFTASRVGVMIPWILCAMSSGVFCLAWIGIQSSGSFIAFAALFGCFSGALIPLPPSVFPVVCPDRTVLGARLGMAQGIGSFASLIGSPIAGALTAIHAPGAPQNFLGLQLFTGLVMVAGAINLAGLWILLIRRSELKTVFI